MKRSLLALAALTAFAGAASAQSSVTLFGIVDAAVARLSAGGKSQTGMTNSSLNSSRLGFRGVEDLGGGMSAGFWIEGQLTNDDGNAGSLNFQRRSTVSLMGGFGEVRLGRDYTPTFWNTTVYDEFGTNGVGQSMTPGMIGTNGNGALAVRSNNSISYFTPAMGGFSLQVMKAFGENVSGGAKTNDYLGFRAGFAAGPMSVHGAYGKTEGATDAVDVKYMNFGASFDAGIVKPQVFVGQEKTGSGLKVTGMEVSVGVVLGQGRIRAAYSRYDQKGGAAAFNANDWNKIAVGYQYNLSKRTALLATYARVGNKGTQTKLVANNGLGAGLAAAPGGNASGFEFGVRHAF
jgi:predicted porin